MMRLKAREMRRMTTWQMQMEKLSQKSSWNSISVDAFVEFALAGVRLECQVWGIAEQRVPWSTMRAERMGRQAAMRWTGSLTGYADAEGDAETGTGCDGAMRRQRWSEGSDSDDAVRKMRKKQRPAEQNMQHEMTENEPLYRSIICAQVVRNLVLKNLKSDQFDSKVS